MEKASAAKATVFERDAGKADAAGSRRMSKLTDKISSPAANTKEPRGRPRRMYALTDVTNAFRGNLSLHGDQAKQDRKRLQAAEVSSVPSGRGECTEASVPGAQDQSEIFSSKALSDELRRKAALPSTYTDVQDIDDPFSTQIQMASAYAQPNAEFMRELEMKLQPIPDYVDKVQSKITSQMRAVLIDWLIEVSDEFKLVTETLYLAIAYIDRFLSRHPINNSDFQLLGVTCMCIASKYEEIHPPHMERFSYITDHVCSVEDINDAEAEVLQGLDFRLASPTPKAFLQRFLRAAHVATTMEYQCLEALARYILELSLLDYSMLRHRCSTVAASAILLARALIVHIPPESSTEMSNATRKHVLWTRTLEQYAFHTARELEDCVRQLHRTLLTVTNKSKKQPFVCTKYKHSKWGKVATLPLLDELPDSMFERFAWFSVPASYLSHVNV